MEELSKWRRDQDTKNQLNSYDMIVSMLGFMDLIKQGRKVYETVNLYKQTITEMKEFAKVTVLQIPSTNIILMMNSVDVFNGRIEKLSILNTDKVMLSRKICDAAYKSKLMIDDGFSLSDHGGFLYAEILDDIPIPEAIKKASVNGDTSNYPKIEITEFVELENKYFGYVIGKSGDNIKGITGDNNLKMTFGKFVESKKNGQTKPEKETEGYIVTGKVSDTMNAKKRVNDSVISAKESENQATYSRK